ncbi:MAG: hypothetical protein ACRDPQ_14495 [Nocardioidaceae bacterium]
MTEQRPRAITRKVLRSLTQDSEPWLSCDDCFELLDEYVERRLADPGDVDTAMATHLEACPACAEEADSLQALLTSNE